MEDAIGFALYEYMEQKRQPAISSNRAFIFWWTLRMCEDDGEVDEDFPPLERTRQIEKYQYEEFAVCEASEIHGNLVFFSKLMNILCSSRVDGSKEGFESNATN